MAASVLAVALSACGSTNWGFPYRPDVQQGNWITSEQVAQLQKGMTREQVRFILGTPTLQDVFRTNRWDYPYYNKPGYGKEQERKFTVWFEGDSLERWEGDEQPNRQPFQKADTGASLKSNDDSNANSAESDSGGVQTSPVDTVSSGSNMMPSDRTPEAATQDAAPQHRQPILNANEPRRADPGVPTPGRNSGQPLL
ncbi:outer membrane protein assembly factor BamE [Alcaligenaceae bacterium]|nr:outer membrane protein assembly factor BamE [Alcaligenaceae bacterium]